MDLGLAPHPLGFGATRAWGWRRAGLGSGFGAVPRQSPSRNVAAFARRPPDEIVESPGLAAKAGGPRGDDSA
jgi:hypothetical protein